MGIIELTLIVILLLCFSTRGEKKPIIVSIVGMGSLFLIAALRHEGMDTDTYRYVRSFENIAKYDWYKLLKEVPIEETKDFTYYYTGWFFSKIFNNARLWLAGIALLYSFAVGKFVYRESKNLAISLLIFVSLGFFSFSTSGLRQAIAMAIALLGYPYLKKRRFIPFVICVLIASFYHKTALIFLIIYPIAYVRFGIYHILVSIAAFILFYRYQGWLLQFFNTFFEEERFLSYINGQAQQATYAGLLIQMTCIIFCFFYYNRLLEMDQSAIVLYNMMFIGCVFQLFSSFIAEFFRISMYFSIAGIVLVANATRCEKNTKYSIVVQVMVIGVFFLYMIRDGAMEYKFFWQ